MEIQSEQGYDWKKKSLSGASNGKGVGEGGGLAMHGEKT